MRAIQVRARENGYLPDGARVSLVAAAIIGGLRAKTCFSICGGCYRRGWRLGYGVTARIFVVHMHSVRQLRRCRHVYR